MKLYEVKRNSIIKIGNTMLFFRRVDGMYSICYDQYLNAHYIGSDEDVEVINDPDTISQFKALKLNAE